MIEKQTINNKGIFCKLPNELFYFPEKNQDSDPKKRKFSILENTKSDKSKFNYKSLFILDFIYMNKNMRNITNFYLKDMIIDCGYKYNTRTGESVDQFKQMLSKLQELKLISSSVNFADVKVNERLSCTLNIDLDNQFFMLYDCDKDKILNQTIDKTDNMNLLVYFCYLNCKMYKRPKGDEVEKSGGRTEVCWPPYKTINKELGFVDDSINKYNKILVELDLIRIGNAGLWYYIDDINKSLKESCNIYTLYTNEEDSQHNIKEGIKYWKQLDTNRNRVFKGTREYENNNRKLNGELGSIIKKENLGTATAEDIIRKSEILESTKPDEDKYKIMSIFESNEGELLSNIFEGKNIKISEKYSTLEKSLGLLDIEEFTDEGEYQLAEGIEYADYKWVMINYKENEHQKFVDWVAKKKIDVFEVIDNSFVKVDKGRGLQNNKRKVIAEESVIVTVDVNDAPDIFEDWFDEDNCDNNELTDEEYQAKQECIELNRAQIPEDVLREIEEDMYNRNKESIFELFI